MSPIDCLIFDCRVPPGIKQNNARSRREIQPGPTCFQRNEEQCGAYLVLKALDKVTSVFGLPGQREDWPSFRVGSLLNQLQHLDKLTEYEHLVPLLHQR